MEKVTGPCCINCSADEEQIGTENPRCAANGRCKCHVELTDEIQTVNLEMLLMPNGELICLGKTMGWYKEYKRFLTKKV